MKTETTKQNRKTKLADAAEKFKIISLMAERKRYAAHFNPDPKAHKEVTQWERDMSKQFTLSDLIQMEKQESINRLRRRYGRTTLQKEPGERTSKRLSPEELEAARARTKITLRKLRRKRARKGIKPVVYSLKLVQAAVKGMVSSSTMLRD